MTTRAEVHVKPLMFHVEQRKSGSSFCRCQKEVVLEKPQLPANIRHNISISVILHLHVSSDLRGRKRKCKQVTTFQSPARGPEIIPSSMTSMHTNGCLRLGACFRACALANLSISLASPRGSNSSVL